MNFIVNNLILYFVQNFIDIIRIILLLIFFYIYYDICHYLNKESKIF